LEKFDVLRVDYTGEILESKTKPFLSVTINYQEEFISLRYRLDIEKNWRYSEDFRLLEFENGTLVDKHFFAFIKKKTERTLSEFRRKMKELAPIVLAHPKVRLKSVIYK